MYNLMQFMAVGSEMDVRPQLEPGATPRIQRALLQRVAGPDVKSVHLNRPDGLEDRSRFRRRAISRCRRWIAWACTRTDPAIPPTIRSRSNLLDANESNLMPVTQPPGNLGEAHRRQCGQITAGIVVVDRGVRGAAAAADRVVGLYPASAPLIFFTRRASDNSVQRDDSAPCHRQHDVRAAKAAYCVAKMPSGFRGFMANCFSRRRCVEAMVSIASPRRIFLASAISSRRRRLLRRSTGPSNASSTSCA